MKIKKGDKVQIIAGKDKASQVRLSRLLQRATR